MDRLDVRILGALLGGDPSSPSFRPPFRGVARRLGVDEKTVRTRLDKLRATGFLKGWLVAVNPSLLSQRVVQVWLEVGRPSRKPEVLQQVGLVDGVCLVLDYYGAALGVHLYYSAESELDRRLSLIARIAGATRVERHGLSFPPPDVVLGRTDWRIIRSIQHDPWRPYVAIAKEIGATSATIKRRLARLNRAGALFLLARIDPRAAEGSLLGHLFVFYDSAADRNRVDEELRRHLADELAFAELDNSEFGFYALRFSNLSRVRHLRGWLEQLPGVQRARLELLEDMVPYAGIQEEFVRAALEEKSRR